MSANGFSDGPGRRCPPLRIVHCFRSPVGGIFRHVRDLARAQAEAGHAVGIVCDSTTGGAFEAALFAELSGRLALGLRRLPMAREIGPRDAADAWRCFAEIRRMQPDVIHGHGAKGGVYARLFGTVLRQGRRTAVARLYAPHGGSLHYDPRSPAGRLIFGLERAMQRLTDHLVFVSDFERQTFARKVGRLSAPHSLVYNGVADAEFLPAGRAPDAADFLFIGMMRDLKGPDIFLDALALAERLTGRRLRAAMVGAGDDLPRYQAQAIRLGFGEGVVFLPPMPARQAFELADLVVVPSRAEALPYIVLEALAAGKPMIATAVGGIPEIFGKDSPALVAPFAPALAEKMAAALADPVAFRARMPSPAALSCRFGIGVMAARIEAIYRAALGPSGAKTLQL